MIDIVGAIVLAASSVGLAGALVLGSPLAPRRAARVLVLVAAWFSTVTVLAGLGVFTRLGPPAVGLAVLAPVAAWLASRRVRHWRVLTLAWNAFGLLDLIAAVTLGIGSAPDSAVRFIVEDSAPGTMGTLPWLLIPAFLVPLYVLTPLAVFARIAADPSPSPAQVLADVRHH